MDVIYGCVWCDSQYACMTEEKDKLPYQEMTITDIITECEKYPTQNITLTGGEPLIHPDVKYLIQALCEAGYDVNVETNGSVDISEYFNEDGYVLNKYNNNLWFTVDYKCPSSGMDICMLENNFDVYKNKYRNIVYKFVVGSIEDLNKANEIITEYIMPGSLKYNCSNYIYLSPVFGEIEPKDIVTYMQKNNMFDKKVPIRVQLQLHKIIWPADQRGV